jgi:transcription elongation GreA/GreB family factor
VTPASPIGGAVMGRKVGDVVDIAEREWQISYVG